MARVHDSVMNSLRVLNYSRERHIAVRLEIWQNTPATNTSAGEEEDIETAAQLLTLVNQQLTPLGKLDCLNRTIKRCCRQDIPADQLIPLIIQVLIRSNCDYLLSELDYIRLHRKDGDADIQFCLTSFEASLEHILQHEPHISAAEDTPRSPSQEAATRVYIFGNAVYYSSVNPEVFRSLENKNIASVTCGEKHGIACSKSGAVYTFGWGVDGRLGLGDEADRMEFTRIDTLESARIVSVSLGSGHSVVLSAEGEMYSFGWNSWGQLGLGDIENRTLPVMIPAIPGAISVRHVSCGGAHTVFITSGGEVYSFGRGANGRLGHGDEKDVWSPRRVVGKLRELFVSSLTCGGSHTLCGTEDGLLFSFGKGADGQLGHGDEADKLVPSCIDYLRGVQIKQLAAGFYHSAALTDEGIYIWGWGEVANSIVVNLQIRSTDKLEWETDLTNCRLCA